MIFSKRLESGNTHCVINFKAIYKETKEKINQIPNIGNKRIIIRIDGGYFSRKNLKFIKNEQIQFVTKCKINLVSIKELVHANKNYWQPLKENVSYLYFKDQQIYSDLPVNYNILIIKEKRKILKSRNCQIYHTIKEVAYALVTNLDYSPKKLWIFYKNRQTIENCFKEHNQSFKAGKLPSHKFYGNASYLEQVCLCYNISFFFKNTLINSRFRKCSFSTIRTKFIKLAGQISSENEMTLIELSQRYRYKAELRDMLKRLKHLISP